MRYVVRPVRFHKCPPRPLTAWAPTRSLVSYPVVFFRPWRIFTIRH